jgi:hypothetical protein
MPKPIITDHEILQAALLGLQHSLASVDEKIMELRRRIGGKAPTNGASAATNGTAASKRVMSPAARRRIAAAQKKRWAAFRKAQQN